MSRRSTAGAADDGGRSDEIPEDAGLSDTRVLEPSRGRVDHEFLALQPAMSDMIEGGCLCGLVRYRADGPPLSSLICHCRTCRRASGAPSVAWLTFAQDRFQWLSGAPQRHASSPGVVRGFCSRCGTGLVYESEQMAGMVDVTTASLDDPSRHPPTRQTWVSHRIDWAPVDHRIAQLAGGFDGGPAS